MHWLIHQFVWNNKQASRGLCDCCQLQCWRMTRSTVWSWMRIVAARSSVPDSLVRAPAWASVSLASKWFTCTNSTAQSSGVVEWRTLLVLPLCSTSSFVMRGSALVIRRALPSTASRVKEHLSVCKWHAILYCFIPWKDSTGLSNTEWWCWHLRQSAN